MVSLSEAEKEWKLGLKALKTGLFKWKPDVNGAAIHFDKASKGFQIARKYPEAINCYIKLADCNEKLHDMWAAGRNFEQLSSLYIQTEEWQEAMNSIERAAQCFRIHGSNDKALNMYADMGRQFAQLGYCEFSCKCFIFAINLIQDENLQMFAKDVVSSYANVLLENFLYRDAQALYEKELGFATTLERDHYVAKACLCIIGVVLASNTEESRFRLAEEKVQELCMDVPGFVQSNEYESATDIIEAAQTGDQERYDRAVRRACWGNVENPLVREVRKIRVPEAPGEAPVAPVGETAEDVADFLR